MQLPSYNGAWVSWTSQTWCGGYHRSTSPLSKRLREVRRRFLGQQEEAVVGPHDFLRTATQTFFASATTPVGR